MTSDAPALPATEGAVRLNDWGLIRAQGEDTRKFLHGQLTQDVERLERGQARLAGYCSAKGRLLATFVAWRGAGDEVLLACSADLLPAVLERLSKFVLRSRCKLSDASSQLALWGLAGDSVLERLGAQAPTRPWQQSVCAGADVVALPPARLGSDAAAMSVPRWLWAGAEPPPMPPLPALPAEAWAALEVFSAVPRIVAATAEQFVPQMVNLELVGGVDFRKGCYPGQEIVARSQYRGTLKRRGQILRGLQPMPVPRPGQEIFHDADPGQPAGQVVLAAALPGGSAAALVELKLAASDGGDLHLGSPDGPRLVLASLPYALPADAA